MKVVRAEAAGVGGGKRLEVGRRGEAVDRVRPPGGIDDAEQRRGDAVVVVPHLRHVREIVRAGVFVAGSPFGDQLETVGELEVVELEREALELRDGRAARDELAPALPSNGEWGNDAAQDKHAAEVVHNEAVSAASQENTDGADEQRQPVQFAERGTRRAELLGERCHELDALLGSTNGVAYRQAGGGDGTEGRD